MTYRARISNYRRVKKADIHFDNVIVMIGGRNGDGKTSCAEAVAAGLTGRPIVVRPELDSRVYENAAKGLVHDGEETAVVVISGNNDNATRIQWPDCTVASKGDSPPFATNMAAGIKGASFMDMNAENRASLLIEILKANPTQGDWNKALHGIVSDELRDKVWTAIEGHGWDPCWERAKDKARDLKGQFRSAEVAGVAWGKEKAPKWRPEGWDDNWEMDDIAVFEKAVTKARTKVENAIANQAVDTAGVEDDRKTAGTLDELNQKLGEAEHDFNTWTDTVKGVEAELATIIVDYHVLTCPECGTSLAMSDDELVAAKKPPNDKTLAGRRKKRADLTGKVELAKTNATDAENRIERLQSKVATAEQAQARVEAFDDNAERGGDVSKSAIEELRGLEDAAAKRLIIFKQWKKAGVVHHEIVANLAVADALSPDGVRLDVLATKLDDFNTSLNEHGTVFGMKTVTIHGDMTVTYDERAYHLISESAKFRLRTLIQFVLALSDGSHLIIIDNDVDMDRVWYQRLCKMICRTGKPTLICARFESAKDMPDFEKAPKDSPMFGRSYWIDGGEVKPLADCL